VDEDTRRKVAALSAKGIVHEAAGRLDFALAAFRESTQIAPTYEDHYNAGNMLLQLGRPAEAVDEYDRSIACRDDYAEAWCNRGIALARSGRQTDACVAFERSLAVDPALASARRCLATTYLDRANALKRDRGEDDRFIDSTPGGIEDQIVEVIDRALALGVDNAALRKWAWAEKLVRLQRVAHASGRTLKQYVDAAEHAVTLYPDDERFTKWRDDARQLSA
jgi:tetratricopeptide (TPR) repeat protein